MNRAGSPQTDLWLLDMRACYPSLFPSSGYPYETFFLWGKGTKLVWKPGWGPWHYHRWIPDQLGGNPPSVFLARNKEGTVPPLVELFPKKRTYPAKNAGWKTIFLLKWSLFRWLISIFGGVNSLEIQQVFAKVNQKDIILVETMLLDQLDPIISCW